MVNLNFHTGDPPRDLAATASSTSNGSSQQEDGGGEDCGGGWFWDYDCENGTRGDEDASWFAGWDFLDDIEGIAMYAVLGLALYFAIQIYNDLT